MLSTVPKCDPTAMAPRGRVRQQEQPRVPLLLLEIPKRRETHCCSATAAPPKQHGRKINHHSRSLLMRHTGARKSRAMVWGHSHPPKQTPLLAEPAQPAGAANTLSPASLWSRDFKVISFQESALSEAPPGSYRCTSTCSCRKTTCLSNAAGGGRKGKTGLMPACCWATWGTHGGPRPGTDSGYTEVWGTGTARPCAMGTLTCSHSASGGVPCPAAGER